MAASGFEKMEGGGVLITGQGIATYQALVCKRGLMALQDGFRLNRAYTPKNLHALAGRITGKVYKLGKVARQQAITDLEGWLAVRQAAEGGEVTE